MYYLCECCVMIVVNDDDSQCRYYNHEPHPPAGSFVVTNYTAIPVYFEPVRCDGCGRKCTYARVYRATAN